MAVEEKRGCGYRKVGGTYLMGGKVSQPCGKLPFPLEVCPACGGGIKQTRGWTWFEPAKLFDGVRCHLATASWPESKDCEDCKLNDRRIKTIGRAGLLWIGKGFYKTTYDFVRESHSLGVCRRITAIPRGFVLGETWVFVAHPAAILRPGKKPDLVGDVEEVAGIFSMFQPTAIEKIVTRSELNSMSDEDLEKYAKKDIDLIQVPDDDPDHRGTVYDKEAEGDQEAA